MKTFFLMVFFLFYQPAYGGVCQGRFVNPITDICWSCLFPITIGPVTISRGGEDTKNISQFPCVCNLIPGIPVGFWEPVRLVDVTRIPFCLVNMGGISLAGESAKGKGGPGKGHGLKQSFYQIHWYIYPLIYWMELLTDFVCLEQSSFDVAYLSEFDPLWNDDAATAILEPESAVFGNLLAQGACAVECAATSTGLGRGDLFWCAGCQGGLYPMTGHVANHVGGVQASMLIIQRLIAKFHRLGLLKGTMGNGAKCRSYYMPLFNKSQYKMQMTYPIPWTKAPGACHPLGRTDVIQGSGMNYPYKGEDFGYLIWRKRSCCIRPGM